MSNKNLFSLIFRKKISKTENYKKISDRINSIEKRNEKRIKFTFFPVATCFCTCVLILLFVVLINNNINNNTSFSNEFYDGLPIKYKYYSYAFDISSPNKAVGASRYVFITKINSISRIDYLNPTKVEAGLFSTKTIYDPYTVYNINVIKNIKGELITSESIQIMQNGGISKDGKSYVLVADSKLLNIGEYYIILTGAFENGGILEVTNPDRIVSLGKIDPNVIRDILNGNITNDMKTDKIINKVIENIERYILASQNEEAPNILPNNSIPILDNISKYDINYKK